MSRMSSALSFPPLPCPSSTVSRRSKGTGQPTSAIVFTGIGSLSSAGKRVAAIVIVRGARAFARDHRRTQRIFWSTAHRKRRTIGRFFDPLQHLRTDTLCRFVRGDPIQVENLVCTVGGEFRTKLQSTTRNSPNAAPLLVCNFENVFQNLLGRQVALIGH